MALFVGFVYAAGGVNVAGVEPRQFDFDNFRQSRIGFAGPTNLLARALPNDLACFA
jgi:hypothetical protein